MRRLRFALWLTCSLVGLLLSAAAAADSYICKTAGGTVSGPEPPPECEGGPMRRILPNGAVIEIAPKPTPEQRRQKEEEEKRQSEELARRKEQMHRDFSLLETYKSEAEIEAARNRDLAALQTRIAIARKTLEGVERDRKRLDQEAEFYAAREMPVTLKNAIETNETRRVTQQKVIDEAKAAMDRINDHYDALIRRYRELTKPRSPSPASEKK